jgi:NAD(P)H-nitrite reductase large subunit
MSGDPDEMICFCIGVKRGRIVAAVEEGAHTVEAVRRATRACGGCQSCWTEIEGIIAEVLNAEGQGGLH